MSEKRGPRESLLLPILIPVGVLLVIGAALWGLSRVLLNVSHTAATATALIAAIGIMVVASIVATRKDAGAPAILSLVGGVLGVAMLAGGGALLLGQPHEEGSGEGPGLVELHIPEGAAAEGFEQQQLTAPAGAAFAIHLTSEDPVVHNVDLAPEEGEAPFLSSPDVTGPGGDLRVDVEPLEPGSYFYFCKYHPTTMTGTLTAEEGAEPGGEAGAAITVRAQNVAFDTDTIDLPADAPSTITFENADAGVTHNIAIYQDEAHTQPVFDGTDIVGPDSTDYEVPPIPAGEYPFICDTHPNMAGTAVVGGGPEGGGEPTPEETGGAPPEGG
jgi:plastocyanin